MNVGRDGKVFSHEFLRFDHSHCRLCDMDDSDFDDLHEPYIPKCCEYHSKKECCLYRRRVRHLNPEVGKPADEKRPELDASIVKNCLRAVQAVVDNDSSFLKRFLTEYPLHIDASLPYDPNYTYDHTGKNFTLLQIAIMEDSPEAVELILEFQPDTDIKPYPLLLASHRLYKTKFDYFSDSRYCRSEKIHDMIHLLLAYGANPNILYYDRSSSDKPQTPLSYCILTESIKAVQMLLDHGAKPLPDICTDNSFAHTSLASLKSMLPYPGEKDDKKATSYDLLMSDGQLQKQEMAQIAQQIFCTYMSIDEFYVDHFLKMMIEHGLDVNANYGDLKLIHFACIPPSSFKAVKKLLKHGADINAKDKNGEFTALHLLMVSKSEYMSPDFVEELLSFGADFYIKGSIPVENSNLIPSRLRDIYKARHPIIFEQGQSASAQNLVVNFEAASLQPCKIDNEFPKTALLPPKNEQLRQSYTALDLLPKNFPRDIFFHEAKHKMAMSLNTPHHRPDKASAADKKPLLPPETLPGTTSIGPPNSGLPSQLQYPTPSCPGYDSDVDSRPPPFNPGMYNSHDVDALPPPYEWLFPKNESRENESPKSKSLKKKSWFPWKRK